MVARPLVAPCVSVLALALGPALGCSAAGGASDGEGSGGSGATGGTLGTGATGGSLGTGGSLATGGSGGAPPDPADAEVFAHGSRTLYRLDPITKGVTVLGDLTGCTGQVIDLALDKDGLMVAVTAGALYQVDKATARCTFIAFGDYPNSLSFVPAGTVDANAEALVGYDGATYLRIDRATGARQPIGNIGSGYSSSGDIVSVIGGGTYLTVTSVNCGDCLIEVDPRTGAYVRRVGALGHGAVYGLAYWGGVAYGFSDSGALFAIDLATAATTPITIPGSPSLSFWGAGSSTAAPLIMPE